MELRDDGLLLRRWREDDAWAVFEACQDAEIQHRLPGLPRPYTEAHAHAFVTGAIPRGPYHFAVEATGHLVGSIGVEVDEQHKTGHIGYWCVASARGKGLTTQALHVLCRFAFDDLALERLELRTDSDNPASQRVAEAVGFQREGLLRSHLLDGDGRRRDSVMFSLLPGELTRPAKR